MHPQIKTGISTFHKKHSTWHEINFYFSVSSTLKSCRLNEGAYNCLLHMTGEYSLEEISTKVKINLKSVVKLVEYLSRSGVIALLPKRPLIEDERPFENQLNFFGDFEKIGMSRFDMQLMINSSHVCIIGVGGIGSWVAYGLALVGVRKLTLIDPDKVEIGNLSRQALYMPTDIGEFKVGSLARRLMELDSKMEVVRIREKIISQKQLTKLIGGVNLVINCADEPDVDTLNRLVSLTCFSSNLPHILCGGYDGHLSFLGPTVIPWKSPCWFCYEKKIDSQKKESGFRHLLITKTDIQGGSMAPTAAITANYHVLEATKVLSGWAKPTLGGRIAEIDFRNFNIAFTSFRRDPLCIQCKRR